MIGNNNKFVNSVVSHSNETKLNAVSVLTTDEAAP